MFTPQQAPPGQLARWRGLPLCPRSLRRLLRLRGSRGGSGRNGNEIIREGRRSYTTIERILFLLSHFIGGAECYAGRTFSVEMLVVYDVMCIRSMYN
jgi:hypothetical protein